MYGLTTGGQIFTVDSNAPGVSVAIGNVRGLQPGEIALDRVYTNEFNPYANDQAAK